MVNTLQLLKNKVFSGFMTEGLNCMKRIIKLRSCYRRAGLTDKTAYLFSWRKTLKCYSI